jgi:hypothetical protein
VRATSWVLLDDEAELPVLEPLRGWSTASACTWLPKGRSVRSNVIDLIVVLVPFLRPLRLAVSFRMLRPPSCWHLPGPVAPRREKHQRIERRLGER